MEKTKMIEAAKKSIEDLLDRRERELEEDLSAERTLGGNVSDSDNADYRKGYAAGYRDLLNDIRNLIVDCGYIEEWLEDADTSETP